MMFSFHCGEDIRLGEWSNWRRLKKQKLEELIL